MAFSGVTSVRFTAAPGGRGRTSGDELEGNKLLSNGAERATWASHSQLSIVKVKAVWPKPNVSWCDDASQINKQHKHFVSLLASSCFVLLGAFYQRCWWS